MGECETLVLFAIEDISQKEGLAVDEGKLFGLSLVFKAIDAAFEKFEAAERFCTVSRDRKEISIGVVEEAYLVGRWSLEFQLACNAAKKIVAKKYQGNRVQLGFVFDGVFIHESSKRGKF